MDESLTGSGGKLSLAGLAGVCHRECVLMMSSSSEDPPRCGECLVAGGVCLGPDQGGDGHPVEYGNVV